MSDDARSTDSAAASDADVADVAADADVGKQIDTLERAGKLADAREFAIGAARAAGAAGEVFIEARLLAKASELALYTQGAESAETLARDACSRVSAHAVPSSGQSPEGPDTPGPESSEPAVSVSEPLAALIETRLALARVHLRIHTDSALTDAQAALDEIGARGLGHHRATRLKLLGLVNARRGRPRAALSHFAEAYQHADGYPALRARVLLTWAVQLRNWGLFDDAQRFAERSLEIRLQLGDLYGAAMCYGTLAFIYQRQGLWERERDALVADLRLCERIGGEADMPGLHARLAGALIGMGKYAGAWSEASTAIAMESRRLQRAQAANPDTTDARRADDRADDRASDRVSALDLGDASSNAPGTALDEETPGMDVEDDAATRVHAFAWRELARVCLAQGRLTAGLRLVARARATFQRVRDGYGQALCQLTEAHLASAQADAAAQTHEPGAVASACRQVEAALAAAQPTFVRLGAVPEAAECILLHVESEHLQGRTQRSADMLAQQVLPMLQRAGLENSPIYRTARETLQRIAPAQAIAHTVTRAAMLRSLAAILTERDAQMGTAVATLVDDESAARAFALTAVDHGGVVLWPDSRCVLAVILGPDHEGRAGELVKAHSALDPSTASGLIDLEHMWPAGVRARGEPVEAALAAVRRSQ